MPSPPPDFVLSAFGALPPVELIVGGQGNTWRAGAVVLKPLDMLPEALRWLADTLQQLARGEDPHLRPLRLAAPLRAKDSDALIVSGWTAWPFLDGTSDHAGEGRWDELIDAGARFCARVRDVPRPPFLDARRDPWAVADRMAWGEEGVAPSVVEVPFVRTLLGAVRMRGAVVEPCQLVHGDLTGNVLLSTTNEEPPAVIDISPYWRPCSYATAIVLVDAVTWEDAPLDWARTRLVDSVARHAFVRALLFRILSEHLREPTIPISLNYKRAVDLICELIAVDDKSWGL